MSQETMLSQTVDEINVNNMKFRVISKRPQYSGEESLKTKKSISNDLYQVFKNYKEE